MAVKVTPTKANLIKSKSSLEFSIKGYTLLDKKRTVLIQEIMKLVEKSEKIEKEIEINFSEAYQALQQATLNIGLDHLEDYSHSVRPEKEYDIRTRSVMGVDIPEIVISEDSNQPNMMPNGFYENNPALDVAIEKFNHVKMLSYQLAEIEGTAFKLSVEIKKTQKSANALEKIQIPRLKETVKYIEESIEEKDREENFRIKKVKKRNNS